jgi:ABC-type transport system substrate-binding protein
MLALGAVRCGRDRSAGRSSQLVILYPGDEWVLGPTADMQAKLLVFLPLAGRNGKGELVGRLVESWEHTPDYGTWTVRLRKGIQWHDGFPVTAHDVKFTLDLLTRVEAVSPAVAPGSYTVTVLDDYTYTITLHRRAAGVPTGDPGLNSLTRSSHYGNMPVCA